jgi:hypothetical protein
MRGIQILDDPGDRSRPWVAAIAQIEHEARVAEDFFSETGGRNVTAAEELFNFCK